MYSATSIFLRLCWKFLLSTRHHVATQTSAWYIWISLVAVNRWIALVCRWYCSRSRDGSSIRPHHWSNINRPMHCIALTSWHHIAVLLLTLVGSSHLRLWHYCTTEVANSISRGRQLCYLNGARRAHIILFVHSPLIVLANSNVSGHDLASILTADICRGATSWWTYQRIGVDAVMLSGLIAL